MQMEQIHQLQRRSEGKDFQTDIGEVFQVLSPPLESEQEGKSNRGEVSKGDKFISGKYSSLRNDVNFILCATIRFVLIKKLVKSHRHLSWQDVSTLIDARLQYGSEADQMRRALYSIYGSWCAIGREAVPPVFALLEYLHPPRALSEYLSALCSSPKHTCVSRFAKHFNTSKLQITI